MNSNLKVAVELLGRALEEDNSLLKNAYIESVTVLLESMSERPSYIYNGETNTLLLKKDFEIEKPKGSSVWFKQKGER